MLVFSVKRKNNLAFSENQALSIKDVIAMRQKLQEDAKNGRTFSLRDIIAMKNDYLDDKSISAELGARFKRPIPQQSHASRYTNIKPAKVTGQNHWLPRTTTRTTTARMMVRTTTKSSVNLMDLIARRRQQNNQLVTTAKPVTTAAPAVRIQNAYAAQRATVLERLEQRKETTTDRFRTRVVPFTTASPRTFRTRQVPFRHTTAPMIKATIMVTTPRPRARAVVAVPMIVTTTAQPVVKTTMNPVRAAFLRQLQMQKKTASTTRATTTTTTTALPEVNTGHARQNFLERLQSMKAGRTNAPIPETIKSTTEKPAGTPNASRLAFFRKLKEQMKESNSTSLAKEIESKREFFMRMMKKKDTVPTTVVTTTTIKMSKNKLIELEAINKAKAALMGRLNSKPTESSARAAFLKQLQQKKIDAAKSTTSTTTQINTPYLKRLLE